jgi:hypothetical protein
MSLRRSPSSLSLLATLALVAAGCSDDDPTSPGPRLVFGAAVEMGGSSIRTFAEIDDDGTPLTLGYTFSRSFLEGLPQEPSQGTHCLDVDGSGTIEAAMECVGGHERVMELPPEFLDEVDSPFDWALLNWNPVGHPPPGVFTVGHFDFHFYIVDLATRNSMDLGTCGLLMDCDDFAVATAPIPAEHMPQGYMSLGAAEAFMGDHLVNPTDPVFNGGAFTEVFIYGGWDGAIAFYEPMVTHAWLEGVANGTNPDGCRDLALSTSYAVEGWYPTRYCIDFDPDPGEFSVSLESWVYRS